ncbi:hypothetical protein [Nocardia arthritidis]|uniref:Uncharacterized protein n=1 Tax=Nocardia arthritidis TaxID=228602 RepID=A0A6G9YI63_9NOCA|nr:hypothetical protein [Nocardia arthritidis]QIS12726.1 hypothetical protein F5544_24355 [Nocardia arthritidis]
MGAAVSGLGLAVALAGGVLVGNIEPAPSPHMSSGGAPFPAVIHQRDLIGSFAAAQPPVEGIHTEIQPPGKGIIAEIDPPSRGIFAEIEPPGKNILAGIEHEPNRGP